MSPDPTDGSRSLLDELRHRGVIGVAIVYAVVGWTLVQVADAVFPALGLPDWAVTLVVAMVLLGLPLALVLAWAFERTPDGVRRAPAAPGRRVAVAVLGGAALVSVLAFVLTENRVGRAEPGYSSIAVLPFEDLSPGDQSYFSEGIAEELMAVLATVPDLDVVGRASSFAFRQRSVGAAAIGEELGVDVVLDGSVRRDGDDLRISVQLIDVGDDRLLWSRRFDRRAGDVFALQDEIAAAVAGEVDVRLSLPAPVQADAGRLRAHDLYLRGLAAWHRRSPDDLREAAALFERAAAADPSYAPAHAGIALTHALLPLFIPSSTADHAAVAERAARRALELDPSLAEGHAALSQRAMVLTRDRTTAVREARRAIDLRPSYATGWQWYAESLLAVGRIDEARAAIDRAVELNPLAPAPRNVRAAILLVAGDPEAALREVRSGRERFPDAVFFHDALLSMGLCAADTALIREGTTADPQRIPREVVTLVEAAIRAPAGSEERRERLRELRELTTETAPPTLRSLLDAALGEEELALDEIEAAVDSGDDPTLLYYYRFPCLDPIRDHARFRAAMDRLP
jgi:adenylate cyclase